MADFFSRNNILIGLNLLATSVQFVVQDSEKISKYMSITVSTLSKNLSCLTKNNCKSSKSVDISEVYKINMTKDSVCVHSPPDFDELILELAGEYLQDESRQQSTAQYVERCSPVVQFRDVSEWKTREYSSN